VNAGVPPPVPAAMVQAVGPPRSGPRSGHRVQSAGVRPVRFIGQLHGPQDSLTEQDIATNMISFFTQLNLWQCPKNIANQNAEQPKASLDRTKRN
jgi:hypothetical protein